ncbi:hypothetical protein [Paractinoplanes durhamensis]|uniref:Uncharacterized protein n=1 Tax=Paractinoplanes durhamensis TaxID=113563 RepID=A0ABQ3Z6D0_9ACTN|nr:hypothetical protein [Actinoplanes durhamensis]GIE05114.1 hypothetical protein Adu01nite_64640 [Actinoplanes durhamensis]
MTDANPSGLNAIRIDGDALRALPEEVRSAALVVMAYVDGLAEGQRRLLQATQPPAAQPPAAPPQANVAGEPEPEPEPEVDVRAQLENEARIQLAAAVQSAAALLGPANFCGAIAEAAPARTPITPAPFHGREVVVVWGPDAHRAVRRNLP